MKIVAVTQARMGSSRLPGKILMEVNNMSLLEIHLERIRKCSMVGDIIVATTMNESDYKIIELCEKLKISTHRGSEEDVLDRFYEALAGANPDYFCTFNIGLPIN